MTYEETRQILSLLKVNYPQSFRNMTKDEGKAFLNLWSTAFQTVPLSLVKMAVTTIIIDSEREFAPTLGQVFAQIKKMLLPNTEAEAVAAWEEVMQFIRNYHQDDYHLHYHSLPERTRKILKMTDIRMIANAQDKTTVSVEHNNFIKRYSAIKEEEESSAITAGTLMQIADKEKVESLTHSPFLGLEMKGGDQ